MDEVIMERDVLEGIFDGRHKPTDLKLSALQSITENFSEERIIGQGGFGIVYKGVLQNGEVAVKRIKNNHTIDEKVFRREVTSLLNVSHENIVRFLGFCSHTEHKAFKSEESRDYIYAENRERILCFEYVKNGSLENFIADELRGLQWDTRYSIIKGICMGLHYLHVETGIIHMDLKPGNILIDNNMIAKITDFGLSRFDKNAQTKSTDRASTPGYTAPEYIEAGVMSVKYDIYSLGVIIIELVTGSRSIPHSNNVIRRWSHRWHNSGKETPFRYEQIAKLIEIGLLCQEKDPFNRPFISQIMEVINELECNARQISSANESTVGQIIPYLEDDMLGIEPLELRFPFELNKQISCSLKLTNKTNVVIAFNIQTTSPLLFCIHPNKDTVDPQSKCSVNITLEPLDKAPQDKYTANFTVRSTKVNDSRKNEDITEDIFNAEDGKLLDEVILMITYKAEVPEVDLSLGSLILSGTRNLQDPQASNEPPTEAESKISASTSNEIIQFDPPELCFPLVPNKKVFSSISITNVTESYVSFFLARVPNPKTEKYKCKNVASVLPPRCTECVGMIREEGTEDAVEDIQVNHEFSVLYTIVDADIKASDLNMSDYNEHKNFPIVLRKINSCTSNELIRFDPPELSFPCKNKTSFSSVNIVNITDCYVGVNTCYLKEIAASCEVEPPRVILPPRSTQRVVVRRRIPNEKKPEVRRYKDKFYVWNMIVAEGVQASNIQGYTNLEDSTELPLTFITISPSTSEELIRLDHPGLRFTISQNKTALSSINMVNVTDYFVAYRLINPDKAAAVSYHIDTELGILAPRSAQRLVVARLMIKETEPEDTQYNKLFMWNAIVSEGTKVSDLDNDMSLERNQCKEFPVTLNKTSTSTSVELIKFEPPEVCFPFFVSKNPSSSIKMVNITDSPIGFSTHVEVTNVALYITKPPCGILPPWSTQELVVTRVTKEEVPEPEDMQCKDKYFVWSCLVTEGVNASDLEDWIPKTKRKQVPIAFVETNSNELIQFDPPELCLPMVPNKEVLFSPKIINITDKYIRFIIRTKKTNSARYYANPSEGVLPPLSMQVLLVTRIAEGNDTLGKDKFLVSSGIVTEDVRASDVIDNMPETKFTEFPKNETSQEPWLELLYRRKLSEYPSIRRFEAGWAAGSELTNRLKPCSHYTEFPIVLTKTSSFISDDLIQFDPPELHFPFFPNKKVSSSIKLVNLTDYNVGFNTYRRPTNAAWYHTEPPTGILPPRSTQKLIVTREEKKYVLEKKHFDDKYFVWKSIVSEGVKDSDLTGCIADQESKELPIVLDKISSSISDELIQFDPPELFIPLLLDKTMLFRVNVVNTTDLYVAFHAYWIKRDASQNKISVGKGILPPRSTEKLILAWVTSEIEIEDMEPRADFFVWNRAVTERVDSGDIIHYMGEEETKNLPFILNKASPCTSNELIQFDPPKLSIPFMPNKPLVFSVNIVNSTDYCVGVCLCNLQRNVGLYYTKPQGRVMPPRSTQRLVVTWIRDTSKPDDVQWKDRFVLRTCLVNEGIETRDFVEHKEIRGFRKELPIVYTKTSLCSSDELIQFDPPQLTFPILTNNSVRMVRKFKIVNVTEHIVGFHIWAHKSSSGLYMMAPREGIMSPQSSQEIKIRRTPGDNETGNMEGKDKIFVWNGIVTEGIQPSDLNLYEAMFGKEVPVVFTKPGERS